MDNEKFEGKMKSCYFKMSSPAAGEMPIEDFLLICNDYTAEIISKTPKTYEEFKRIFDKYENRYQEELDRELRIRKIVRELEEKWGVDD